MSDLSFTLIYRKDKNIDYQREILSGSKEYIIGTICFVLALFDPGEVFVEFNAERNRIYNSEQLMWFSTYNQGPITKLITLTGSVPADIPRRYFLWQTTNPPDSNLLMSEYVKQFTGKQIQITMPYSVVVKSTIDDTYTLMQFMDIDFIDAGYSIMRKLGVDKKHIIRINSGSVPVEYIPK